MTIVADSAHHINAMDKVNDQIFPSADSLAKQSGWLRQLIGELWK